MIIDFNTLTTIWAKSSGRLQVIIVPKEEYEEDMYFWISVNYRTQVIHNDSFQFAHPFQPHSSKLS